MKTTLLLLALILSSISAHAQKLGFQKVLDEQPNTLTVFCVPNNEVNLSTLEKNDITIKFVSDNWIFINATPSWIQENIDSKSITDFYFEMAPPVALADTSRLHHFVDPVHAGQTPLESAYTGEGVIIGVVDQGLDYNHPDFLDANGNTRVLRYWDHSITNPQHAPAPYNYGEWWDSTSINNGTCTSIEAGTAHGTTVAGMAAGNGFANGLQKGIAPDANLIIVETNFNLPNWTLTIADACDFIFKTADSLNMRAVVNLSLGTYFGSHDATDPAAEQIDALLDEHPGRIVVCAAGNSGTLIPYHNGNNVTTDTNFVWFKTNPNATLGAHTIYFDLWSDLSDANFSYAMGADTPNPGYDFRGRTSFHNALPVATFEADTIWNDTGDRIATVEFYTETVGSNFHLQVWMTNLDSTSYLFRFETTGSGRYDLWSGSAFGYNNMVIFPPTAAQMPDIVKYIMPDTLQSIVSSWNCSDQVVSVGNFGNRKSHVDLNGNTYVGTTPVGAISPGSSKGPTRHNLIKPDVIAAGDVTLCAGPLDLLSNTAANNVIDQDGWHVRNGGTSMASPIVAGIAALYLERCNYASYSNFIQDIHTHSYSDAFTGVTPNNAAGYGKPNAFELLQSQTLETTPVISYLGQTEITSSPSTQYQWNLNGVALTGETNQTYTPAPPYGPYTVTTINDDGCAATSAPLTYAVNLDEIELDENLVYPNPSIGTFNIELEDIQSIQVYDQQGRSVQFKDLGNGNYTISDQNKGAFFIIINTVNKNYISKVIVQ